VAIQDQALSTNCFKVTILQEKLKVNADCVKNTKKLLTTQHQEAPFWQRMNTPRNMIKICTHLHYSMCKKSDIETGENCYSYVHEAVC